MDIHIRVRGGGGIDTTIKGMAHSGAYGVPSRFWWLGGMAGC